MRIFLFIGCLCLATATALDLDETTGTLLEWMDSNGLEGAQEIVDSVISKLVESGEKELLGKLIEALQKKDEMERREELKSAQTINAGKKGHCCLGGQLTVSYHNKEVIVPVYHSTQSDTHTASRSCGAFGWSRCSGATTSTNHKVYYEEKKILVKVPTWTCGVENAVCCHGYVTIKKIPGGLAEVGKNNCIESKKALFTIIQLQLMEKVAAGKLTLSMGHMDSILSAVDTFFSDNDITEQDP